MDSNNNAPLQLTAEAAAQLEEGINLVLSRWATLQMAVENEWGGRESRQKSQDLALDILTFFTGSREKVYIDDLEEMLDEFMFTMFSAEVDDGSIEEVAEKLMVLHEECAEGNFESISELKQTIARNPVVSYSRKDDSDDEDDAEDNELGDESSDMAVDAAERKDMMVDEPRASGNTEAEDGWTVVSSKRKNGRRN